MKRTATNLKGGKYNNSIKSTSLLIFLLFLLFAMSSGFCTAQISRAQVITNAQSYVTFSWTAASCNLWSGIRCSNAKIYSAPWVTVGENTSMPYCWGGWSSITQFNTAMAGCKSAGQVCSSSGGGCSGLPSAPLSCAGGMDCSGMVTRAWELTTKYSTSTLVNISMPISLSSVQPGDILNIAGSHVRLVYSNNGSSITVIETSGADWKTAYHTYTPAQIASYVPRCPNPTIVSGGCGVTPPANDDCANAVSLTPGTTCNGTSGDIAGATQSYPSSGCPSGLIQDVWYKFTATSTGNYTITLTPSSGMDGVVEAREGSCTGTVLGCADIGGGNGKAENLIVAAPNGTTYYIRVYEYNIAGDTTPPQTTGFTICVTGGGTSPCTVTSIVPVSVPLNPEAHTSTPNQEITVTAQPGCTFSVSESCSWVTITPMSGTTNEIGQALLNYSVQANTTASSRSCTVTVNGSPFTITQDGCTYSISSDNQDIPASGTNYTMNINTFSPCPWSIQNPCSWVHLSSSVGTGPATFTVTVDPNSCEPRSCTLTITPGNATNVITQQGIVPELSLSSNSLNFPAAGGSNPITLTSNLAWTASPGASWITVSPSSGNGNGTLTITVAANTGAPRNGNITVSGCNQSEVITVLQEGTTAVPKVDYPSVSGITWTVGQTYTITWSGFVASNVKVELYQGTKRNRIITSSVANNGSFVWTVPSNQKTGINFFIKITSATDASMYDYSDSPFAISSVKSGIIPDVTDRIDPEDVLNIYPNPFGSAVTIRFQVLKDSKVSLVLYDVQGQKVKELLSNQTYRSGIYEMAVNSTSLVPGTYYCEFRSGDSRIVRQLVRSGN